MIRRSGDFRQWQDIEAISTMEQSQVREWRVPVRTVGQRGFFVVERRNPGDAAGQR